MAQDKTVILGRDPSGIIRMFELDAQGRLRLASGEVAGTPLYVSVVSGSIVVTDPWTLALVSDTTANDNDKTETVPAGYEWQVLSLFVTYTSDANAGDRQLEVSVRDGGDNVIMQFRPGAVQAASLTYYYMFAPSMADLTALRDTDYMMTPFPPTLFMPANYDIRVRDNNNVSGNDDMVIRLLIAARQT